MLYIPCKILHTQCKVEYTVLSQNYRVSSVKFLGLKLRLCKKKIKIRYAFTTPTSEQQKKDCCLLFDWGKHHFKQCSVYLHQQECEGLKNFQLCRCWIFMTGAHAFWFPQPRATTCWTVFDWSNVQGSPCCSQIKRQSHQLVPPFASSSCLFIILPRFSQARSPSITSQ